MELYRPKMVLASNLSQCSSDSASKIACRLQEGKKMFFRGHYGLGVSILGELKKKCVPKEFSSEFEKKRIIQERYLHFAKNLLVEVKNHRVQIRDVGEIPFLKELYPKERRFFLPLHEVQELYGSWKRYQKGIMFPVLGHRLHPFYGVYAPTRSSHLELFSTWLHGYKGSKERCIDIGAGCGILSFLLARAQAGEIIASDINPNSKEIRGGSCSPW